MPQENSGPGLTWRTAQVVLALALDGPGKGPRWDTQSIEDKIVSRQDVWSPGPARGIREGLDPLGRHGSES